MRLENISWLKAQDYFKHEDTVIFSVGSIESHGCHMPLGTDTLIPNKILEYIDENSNSLIVPGIPYGACDSLSDYPGTINWGMDLLYQVLTRLVNELYRHGARHFVIVNGHGGNIKVIDQVGFDLYRKGALLANLNWWLMAWDLNPAWKGGHGGAEETAAILGVDPKLVDKSQIGGPLKFFDLNEDFKQTGFSTVEYKGVSVSIPRIVADITDSGWIGPDHPKEATEAWGQEMLQASSEYILDFIESFKKVELPKPLTRFSQDGEDRI